MEIKSFSRKIWLSSPTMHGEELQYITEAYETNWMSTVGHNIDEIESIVCDYVGRDYAVALSSGTSALHLAVKLAGVRPGEKVFCSDLTFAATVNPVVYENGTPIFIDSETETWNMDPAALERAFEQHPDVRVVIAVNLYGTPAKLDEIRAVCDRNGALLIEDAAESLGSMYRGKRAGSFGAYSVISFNGNKIITGSSGGILLTDDPDITERARKWSTQSRENAPWYQHEEIGYNYRMSNVIAGVIRGQFPYLDEHIAQKKAIYTRYKEGFRDIPVTMNPYDEENSMPNFWLSCLLIEEEVMGEQIRSETEAHYIPCAGKTSPTEILEALAAYNVEGRPIWKPMHLQPLYREAPFVTTAGNMNGSVSEDIFRRGLCLPSDNKITPEQQDILIEIVRSCFE